MLTISNKTFNPARIRNDFPILQQTVYGHPLVYLDNAATTQKPIAVLDAMDHYYRHDHSNVHRGVHALSERATASYENARITLAEFINARDAKEIVFTKGTTEAINLIAQSYGRSRLQAGDEIIISTMEHHSNIVPWQLLCQQTGAVLRIIPINHQGELLLDEYEKLLNARTKIVAVTHASNALGTINPIKKIIALAHQYNAVAVVDGAQAVAHMSVDVQALDCDFYAFSAHKLYGPTGVGVLYGKAALLDAMPPYQGGGDMIKMVSFTKSLYNDIPYKFEAGTPNIAGVVGLAAAIDYLHGLDHVAVIEHEQHLLAKATAAISQLPGIQLVGTAKEKTSILSFTMTQAHPHDIGTILDRQGIAVRSGHHCAMPLMEYYGLAATVRASFACYNTEAEVDALVQGLMQVQRVFG